MSSIIRTLTLAGALATSALLAAPGMADDAALEAARADMAATLGPDAVELNVLPDAFLAPTWAQTRAWLIDQDSTIPPKYRALIGLAVSSQIPCQYCIYGDTSDARVFGATEEEIKEAIMFGAMTRMWSTIMNGNQVDFEAFKAEIDAGAAAMRAAMAEQPAEASN